MCGLVGILDLNKKLHENKMFNYLFEMAQELKHRGPDSYNQWVDEKVGLGFAFQRLSIQDLSTNGNQPMSSKCKRYVIIFNGEIYNFLDLRKKLESSGFIFVGGSDTEVLLAAITEWGLEKALKNITGMFAFALWDKKNQTLQLVRDRVGEKPLYYGWQKDIFFFASELKALKKYPHFDRRISNEALSFQLKFGNIPAPFSIYENVHKLMPASFITIKVNEKLNIGYLPKINKYWSPINSIDSKKIDFINPNDELENILIKSIKNQSLSDVPLGVFLSGGIDSTLVTSLMQANSSKKINSFSIGFEENSFNESLHAKKIAQHLQTYHNELIITPSDALEIIPTLSKVYDEPFSDISQIPTLLLAQYAKKKVTVSLTGDGGDEVFGGYNRHVFGSKIYDKYIKLPKILKKTFKSILTFFPDSFFNLITKFNGITELKEKSQKVLDALEAKSLLDLYLKLISTNINNSHKLLLVNSSLELNEELFLINRSLSTEEQLMLWDMLFYLPNNILVKVDRASMFHSLETRAPYLDHEVIEFALKLNKKYKINQNEGKLILKNILQKYIPKKLFNRPKAGFTVPLKHWLDGPLREWSKDLLDVSKIKNQGILDHKVIFKILTSHNSNRLNLQYLIWNILMFQSWYENENIYK